MSRKDVGSVIVSGESVSEYFYGVVKDTLCGRSMALSEHAEHYLVNLLSEFAQRARLVCRETGDLLDVPLALLLKQAQEAQRAVRYRMLKQLGDVSLYVSGFFGDSLNRKLVDADYYVQMGGAAYRTLASMAREVGAPSVGASLFDELAGGFPAIVDLFAEISERHRMTTETDVLRLYERWLRTGSDRLAAKLQRQGILPVIGSNDGVVH